MVRPWRMLALAGATVAGYWTLVRPRLATYGATPTEVALVLPGDELVGGPADVVTRAVTVDAPAERVWRWLVQIGQNRGGFYTYTFLENLFGLGIRNVEEIRPEFQHLEVGDCIRLIPDRWLGFVPAYELPVARVEEGRSLALRIGAPWDAVWSFHVHPIDARSCRLIARERARRPTGLAQLASWISAPVGDLVVFIMERGMLRGVKARAEAGPTR